MPGGAQHAAHFGSAGFVVRDATVNRGHYDKDNKKNKTLTADNNRRWQNCLYSFKT